MLSWVDGEYSLNYREMCFIINQGGLGRRVDNRDWDGVFEVVQGMKKGFAVGLGWGYKEPSLI